MVDARNIGQEAVRLALKYDRMVPRYTSYPTAPHFGPGVTGTVYRGWLGELAAQQTLSLYLHVPFCDTLCWFCGCHTKVVNRYEPIGQYVDQLVREIELVADALPAVMTATHIHFGGGTPTILTGDDFRAIVDRLRGRFRVAEDAEIAVEIDPRDLPVGRIAALAKARVTRASLGVQDFDEQVQRAVNRLQPYDETAAVAAELRAQGVRSLNIDLMYGLPHQSEAGVVRNVDRALTLDPDRIALFGYAHVPWMKRHQRLIDEAHLPNTEARLGQAMAAAARLVEKGFVQIGLDHFARPDDPMAVALKAGRLNRNFQGYTTDSADALIGFGVSAIGALPQGYVQNMGEVREYRAALTEGQLPVIKGVATDDDDRLRRSIIGALMCALEVDLDALGAAHGMGAGDFAAELKALRTYAADGVVEIEGGRVRITERGRPLVRTVAAVFDRYLSAGAARHSRAV